MRVFFFCFQKICWFWCVECVYVCGVYEIERRLHTYLTLHTHIHLQIQSSRPQRTPKSRSQYTGIYCTANQVPPPHGREHDNDNDNDDDDDDNRGELSKCRAPPRHFLSLCVYKNKNQKSKKKGYDSQPFLVFFLFGCTRKKTPSRSIPSPSPPPFFFFFSSSTPPQE